MLDIPEVVRRQTDASNYAEKDVVSHTILNPTKDPRYTLNGSWADGVGDRLVCAQCGSGSESKWVDRRTRVISRVGHRWMVYENEWGRNCVCGGPWIARYKAVPLNDFSQHM